MTEVLACRGCRQLLTADHGCALCLGVKPHLIVAEASDDESVSLAVVAAEAVGLLRKQLTFLKSQTKLATSFDPVLAGEARAVASTLAKLLDSARKVVQDGADAVAAMSFQERMALFLEWTGSLPAVQRRRVLDSLLNQGDRPAAAVESDGSDVVVG